MSAAVKHSDVVYVCQIMQRFLLENVRLEVTKGGLLSRIADVINTKDKEDNGDAFYMADLGDLIKTHKLWLQHLPLVEPFYAVKCNNDLAVLATLAYLGTGFECASKEEIKTVLDLNVSPGRVVYAHPCKQPSHLRYAAECQVRMVSFDSVAELHKTKAIFPSAQLIVRLAVEDSKSGSRTSKKFGCCLDDVPELLRVARELQLAVIGVSFHVGSRRYIHDCSAFERGVADSREAFDIAKQHGFEFTLLDIGGGFPGQLSDSTEFEEVAAVLRLSLAKHFPEDTGVRIIAEPGRFFVTSAFTLTTNVIAKKVLRTGDTTLTSNPEPSFMYYVNDSIYGSFSFLLFGNNPIGPSLLSNTDDKVARYNTRFWGQSCDGGDCLITDHPMPELNTGDWVFFKGMGAYTFTNASDFTDLPKPERYYFMQDVDWEWFIAQEDQTGVNVGKYGNIL